MALIQIGLDDDSYVEHNRQYEEDGKFQKELAGHMEHRKTGYSQLWDRGHRHGEVLDSTNFETAVDIGSGTGWFSNYLVEKRNYKKVYAIEPSAAAQNIAQKINPNVKEIEWITGFAEEEIGKLKLKKPTFFSTLCVLAHIPCNVVEKILKSVYSVAPTGSVLCSFEPWGPEFHDPASIWHVRTKDWWQQQLPEWNFSFEERELMTWPAHPERFMGFVATKG